MKSYQASFPDTIEINYRKKKKHKQLEAKNVLLNKQCFTKKKKNKEEIQKYLERNEHENTLIQNLGNTVKVILRGKFIAIQPCLSSVQSLSHIQIFPTPPTVAHQASLSTTNSQSLLKLMSTEPVMPSNHLILSSLFPPAFNLSQHKGLFK